MPKPREDLKIAILCPAYRRPEYTQKCIEALEKAQEYKNIDFYLLDDGSEDDTTGILKQSKLPNAMRVVHTKNIGLRNSLITFIEWVKDNNFDMMGVIGNDCLVPKNWLNDMLDVFEKTNVEILSPNVFPSNAAFVHGQEDTLNLGYRPSKIVGGLWFMPVELVKDIEFEKHEVKGIMGAFNILQQIVIEKEPRVGWASDIVVQDMGHWSGRHPLHIKSKEHSDYYQEVGRGIAW